jgi:hypothetical protein
VPIREVLVHNDVGRCVNSPRECEPTASGDDLEFDITRT